MYVCMYVCIYIYIYMYVFIHTYTRTQEKNKLIVDLKRLKKHYEQYSGVQKGGFSKWGSSNLCVSIILLLPNPPLLNRPL